MREPCVGEGGVSLAVQSLFGFFALHAAAWLLSERRRSIPWRPVLAGMALTLALAALFLANKYFEYSEHVANGEIPAHSTFLAIYYTLTGLHGLHIIGGMVVMAYLFGPGAKLWKKNQEQFANRVEATGLYWHFVDLVWIFLFPVLYLL